MASSSRTVDEIIESPFVDPYEPPHQLGPDHIIPTEEFRTWIPNGATKLEVPSDVDPYVKPISTVTFLKKTVDGFPNTAALVHFRDGKWEKWTFKDYWNNVRTAARGFIKLGLIPFHGVGILGFNAPEWLFSYMGSIFSGGIPAGIYTTNSSEACYHILNDCCANIAVVENDKQLQKILKVKNKLPHLKAIIQYTGHPTEPNVFSWNDLMAIGESVSEEILERRIKSQAINQCSALIYTSGTTGNSKGVMLNHNGLIQTVKQLASRNEMGFDEVVVSYLPLSHVAALTCDVYGGIMKAGTLYFATPDALKGKLMETLRHAQPTILLGVPRVFEKIYDKLVDTEMNMSPPKRRLMAWARQRILQYHMRSLQRKTISYKIAQRLVCQRVKKLMGMDKVRLFFSGGAPLSPEVQKYLLSLDIKVFEGYGLSESAGMMIFNTVEDHCFGSVGKVVTTLKPMVKIQSPDEKGIGEIVIFGHYVFMGYLKLEDKTIETIDDDGGLHSGDLGMVDGSDFLYITGRIKELLITSGGENVPPLPIEDTVKQFVPAISNCMLIGDQKKYLTMLITFKVEVDPETLVPLDRLSLAAIKWCQKIGSKLDTVSEILKTNDANVFAGIQAGITRYNNEAAISNAQRIQKWKILKEDFSVPGGELGPTGKIRRPFIIQKYSNVIDSLYAD